MTNALISLPPPGAAAPAAAADLVAADGWYPAQSIATFRAARRVPADVTDIRVREALQAAMLACAQDLAVWRLIYIAAGVSDLADVPDLDVDLTPRTIGGEPRLVVLWRRAVFSSAAADLDDSNAGVDTTPPGSERDEQRGAIVDRHRRDARWAIRDILGRGRSTVELI